MGRSGPTEVGTVAPAVKAKPAEFKIVPELSSIQ